MQYDICLIAPECVFRLVRARESWLLRIVNLGESNLNAYLEFQNITYYSLAGRGGVAYLLIESEGR
jgi:hypothetical protein